MGNNELIIATAGSGKTTYLVKEALKIKDENVLVTTYTDENEEEIKKKFILENRVIPDNVTIQTWFSFLIQHGVKPFRGGIFDERVNGLHFCNVRSAIGIKEADTKRYYFDNNNRIYSDKVSSFTLKCNECNNGEVINRMSKIYPNIFIDEVQDLASYDLDFLDQLFDSRSRIILVCDPRQGTYSTSNSLKYKKYKRSAIPLFFSRHDIQNKLDIDTDSLNINHRSNQHICNFVNKIFPDYNPTNSGQNKTTGHDGVFLIREKDIDAYFFDYPSCIQLRYSVTEKRVKKICEVCNFGNSKGREYDRVLLYPTTPITSWIKDNNSNLQPISRSKFYVAVTRARYSVGIVYNYDDDEVIEGTEKYQPLCT